MLKKIIKSKTMIFGSVLSALGVLQASMNVFTPYFSANSVGVATVVIGMIVAILRAVTTKPLNEK